MTRLTVFAAAVRADGDNAALEIHVGPAHAQGFVSARSAEGEEAQIIGELRAVLGNLPGKVANRVQFCRRDQLALFRVGLLPGQAFGRKRFDMAIHASRLEQISERNGVEVRRPSAQSVALKLRDKAGDVM